MMTPAKKTTIHYNADVSFFQSFLDPYMKYTSGLFDDQHRDLESAIVHMLDHIIAFANIPMGGHVLEIGSGWGSLARRLREIRPDVHYTGVSPSQVQNEFIQSQHPSAKVITDSFENASFSTYEFDCIFMIGSYCHLSDKHASLIKCKSLLKPLGKLIIEDTFFITEELYQKHKNHPLTSFVQKEVFGFAEVFSLSKEIESYATCGFIPELVLEHTNSYKATIQEWILRLQGQPASSIRDQFIKYLEVFQKGWNRTISNQLIALRLTHQIDR